MDENDYKLKKKILKFYRSCTEMEEISSIRLHNFANKLREDIGDVDKCRAFLIDEGYLKRDEIRDGSGNIRIPKIRITANGKKALETIYNPKWVDEEKSKKEKEQKLEERKIRVAESNAKWIKIGAIAAIIAGCIGVAHFVFTAWQDTNTF